MHIKNIRIPRHWLDSVLSYFQN